MSQYLSDTENLGDLINQMPGEDQEVFSGYGHLRIEAGFSGRLFVLYRTTGLHSNKQHKPPEILTTVRLGDFICDSQNGASAKMTDLSTGQNQTITHIPTRVFHYPVFISIPPFSKLRWDARLSSGQTKRSLSYAVLLKSRNRSDFYSLGNTYCETPNDMKALFPNMNLNVNFA